MDLGLKSGLLLVYRFKSYLSSSSAQFQVFSLPKVSAKTKFKLTAHEGCRVRKVAMVVFSSTAQEDYSEHTLVCLTNLGDMHLFSIPALRPQVQPQGLIKSLTAECAFKCVFVSHNCVLCVLRCVMTASVRKTSVALHHVSLPGMDRVRRICLNLKWKKLFQDT